MVSTKRGNQMTTRIRRFSALTLLLGFALLLGGGPRVLAANESLPYAIPESYSVNPGIPVAVTGLFAGIVEGHLAVQEQDGDGIVAFPAASNLTVTRDGAIVMLQSLKPGDTVHMSVDGSTGQVLRVDAAPMATSWFAPSNELALLAVVGLIGGAVLLIVRNRQSRIITPGDGRPVRLAFDSARSMMPRWEAPARQLRMEARG